MTQKLSNKIVILDFIENMVLEAGIKLDQGDILVGVLGMVFQPEGPTL